LNTVTELERQDDKALPDFDLDVRIVEVADAVQPRSTDNGCGSTCPSACASAV
jgi:FxLD family lantipeptide